MEKIKLSLVSYLNTKPFLFGIQNFQKIGNLIDISLDVPSICASKVINNEVDAGIIPTAVLKDNPQLNVFSNYCLGANSEVQTVLLLSNSELKNIDKIYLDSDSKTSVNLVKILAKHFWKINPKWIENHKVSDVNLESNSGIVAIGDKAFEVRKNYKFSYDLAQEWFNFTKKPFVFAVWASNKKLSNQFIDVFNEALQFGINNIDAVVEQVKADYPHLKSSEIKHYLTQNMEYNFSSEKKESLELFLDFLRK